MLCVISFSPGLRFSILAGTVWFLVSQQEDQDTCHPKILTLPYLQHLKKGVMRTKPML